MKKIDRIIQENINRFIIKEILSASKSSGSPFRDREEIDVRDWYKIGKIDYWPYAGKGFLDIWSNPNSPNEYVFLANRDNGVGRSMGDKGNLPSYASSSIQIFDEYVDSDNAVPFLGKRKNEKDIERHNEFMSHLNIKNGKVIIKHNSDKKITDGVLSCGHEKNSYSNNADFGWYGWASKNIGRDPSNGGAYTYYCLVDTNDVYDYETNLKRYTTNRVAATKEKIIAQYWDDDNSIVTASFFPIPIIYIIDNMTGKKYNNKWQEIA